MCVLKMGAIFLSGHRGSRKPMKIPFLTEYISALSSSVNLMCGSQANTGTHLITGVINTMEHGYLALYIPALHSGPGTSRKRKVLCSYRKAVQCHSAKLGVTDAMRNRYSSGDLQQSLTCSHPANRTRHQISRSSGSTNKPSWRGKRSQTLK